jgi:ribose transport system permease protein
MTVSHDIASANVVAPKQRGRRFDVRTILSDLLFATRFAPIWIATIILLIFCKVVEPNTISQVSFRSVLFPIGSAIAIVALGQMLVIMMGGIDLSIAASISLLSNVVVGVSNSSNDGLAKAIAAVFVVAIIIGLVNGVLVAVLDLNPLIVTMSTGLIIAGITRQYREGITNSTTVPDALSDFILLDKWLGISKTFWCVLAITLLIGLVLRSTTIGRRFQAVGANRRAAWMAGIRVRLYVVGAYVAATMAAGVAALIVSGIVVSPGLDPGVSYLFGPVAAVVLGGAALSGGLASPMSTWVAAFFITILNHLLKVLGLSQASQPVVFGIAIIVGMLISGDRMSELIGRLLLRPSMRKYMDGDDVEAPPPPAAAVARVGSAVE